MLASPSRPVLATRSWSPVAVALGLSTAAIAARTIVGIHTPLGAFRAVTSCAAFALVAFGRRRAFVRRAMLALALEATVGLVMFVWVDVPFVRHHAPQVALASVDAYARLLHRDLVADLARFNLLPR